MMRHALLFTGRMTLAYARIALVMILGFVALASLFLLAIAGLILLVDSTTTVDKVMYAVRLITMVVSTTAFMTGILAGIGLIWTAIGTLLGFILKSDEFDLARLPVQVPRYLLLFNMFGLPVFAFILALMFQGHSLAMIWWGVLIFLWNLVNVDLAARAWKRVVNSYALYRQNAKKKKMPSARRLTSNTIATDDCNGHIVHEELEQAARLNKLQ